MTNSTSLLTDSFLRPYYEASDPFQSLLARSVYLTKYCRDSETWTDTIKRIVDGSMALDANCTVTEAEYLFDSFWNMRALPPGRGLWVGGVPGIPPEARFNCWNTRLRNIEDWCWMANVLMLGGGCGVTLGDPSVLGSVTPGATLSVYCDDLHPDFAEFRRSIGHKSSMEAARYLLRVDDTRLGWIEALRQVLRCGFAGIPLWVDVSLIRPRGTPIKTFGGIACGPGPLVDLLVAVHRILVGAAGRTLTTVECLDITNHCGLAIKSGNVRRSALIVLGDVNDTEFRRAKHSWDAVLSHRHTSNNSIVFDTAESIANCDWSALVDDMANWGEPGIVNLYLARQTDPEVTGINPCQPGFAPVLTKNGIRTIDDVSVGTEIWSGSQWTRIVNKWSTGHKQVNVYHTTAGRFTGTENHRVLSNGEKRSVSECTNIDTAQGPGAKIELNAQDIMDGLVIGDGSIHKASNNLVVLYVGTKDDDYHTSEISDLFRTHRPGVSSEAWEVETTVEASELVKTYDRNVPERFFTGTPSKVAGFLRGLFSANGSMAGGRVTLKASSFNIIARAQEMLSAIGISSYYTTNRSRPNQFSNGVYQMRESYDLNISRHDDKVRFSRMVGFLQTYKNEKLRSVLAIEEPSANRARSKTSFTITKVEPLGEYEVFDITVDCPEHTYWTGGLLVSNCGEQLLEDHEACNLAEVFPALGASNQDFELATRYALRQRLVELDDPESNAVAKRNMRIGVGLGGYCDYLASPAKTAAQRQLVRDTANQYADQLGVPRPITVTTVKPSGTISLLNGSSPGMHAPYAPFYIRRTRISKQDPMAAAMIAAGVPYEDCVYDSTGNTHVFSFPVAKPGATSYATTETVLDQFQRQFVLQNAWADNAVSVTISFSEHEKVDLAECLRIFVPHLKSISCLPRQHSYAQPPYEECSQAVFEDLYARIDHSARLVGGGEFDVDDCATGACPVR